MSNTRPITNLDFDSIKADLITFIKSNPTFTDYNFEGSALNAIMDILAFNTHTNAYYANMQHNEGFLDTAQKRGSVVSRAKELGYTPRSSVCSTAYVDITVNGISGESSITIPRGTVFNSVNDNGGYTFIVADTVSANVTGTSRLFPSVKLVNGKRTSNYFTVNTMTNVRSFFTIPNKNIDTSTLKVFVRDSLNSVDHVEYFHTDNVFGLTPTSNSYFLQESHDGFFQIYFGGGVLGKQPVSGNIIDVDYITTDEFDLANGCRLFNFSGTIGTATGITVATTQMAFGGAGKEVLESIKYNAVKSNSAKHRSVSVLDYELILKEKFDFIKSVSVWGGEDNVPPVYGKVFISIQPVSGYTISNAVKNDEILPVIRSSSLLTIKPEFVDPTYTNLEFITKVKFNVLKTTSSQLAIESSIKDVIFNYVRSISTYNIDYLESHLTSLISNIDKGIVSVSLSKRVGFKITPLIGVNSNHDRTINNSIVAGSIKSTKFRVYYDVPALVTIREIPDKNTLITNSDGSVSTIAALGLYTDDLLIKEIGTVNLYTGAFNFSFNLYAYITSNRFISINCVCKNVDLVVDRNQILNIDTVNEDSAIGMVSNNVVITELYGK